MVVRRNAVPWISRCKTNVCHRTSMHHKLILTLFQRPTDLRQLHKEKNNTKKRKMLLHFRMHPVMITSHVLKSPIATSCHIKPFVTTGQTGARYLIPRHWPHMCAPPSIGKWVPRLPTVVATLAEPHTPTPSSNADSLGPEQPRAMPALR